MTDYDGWVAQAPDGHLILGHAGYTRRQAMQSVLNMFGEGWSWKTLYRKGWRLVKVRLMPV